MCPALTCCWAAAQEQEEQEQGSQVYTIHISRSTLLNFIELTNGKFFRVTFVKKNGEVRSLTGRIKARKYVTGAGLRYDPSDYGLMTVFDVQNDGWRMVNLNTVTELVSNKIKYLVEG